jgi:hypothetical protein
MTNKTLLINKDAFIEWYFDHYICKEFFYRHNILESLTNHGVFTVTLQHILDGVGYLPIDVVAEGQEPIVDDRDEVCMDKYDTITFGSKEKYICEECGHLVDGSFGDRRAELYLHTSAKGDYMVKVCDSCYDYHNRQ